MPEPSGPRSEASTTPTTPTTPIKPTTPTTLAGRLAGVRERIAGCGRDPGQITLVAVTKGFDASVAREAMAAGLTDLGESYVQELVAKAPEVVGEGGGPGPRPVWHFVGRLQRNKVRQAASHVSLWHSVDRVSLAAEIATRSPGARILIQVNLSDEPQKGGCAPAELPGLLVAAADMGLTVEGLMTIGPQGPAEEARPVFSGLSLLADRHGLAERSMGMSGDLETAVQEGATMIRVGSALFGPRPGPSRVEDYP